MRRFFRFRVFGFLMVAIIVAVITLITVNTRGNAGILTNALTSLSKPLRSFTVSVVKTFESIYGYIYEYENVVAENEWLKDELATLQKEYRDYIDVSNENERLYELLDLKSRHPEYEQYDSASIISWAASNWSSSFTINKGSYNSEIKVGDSVITESGALIGTVSEVGANSSTVVTVLDTTFSVGAYIERNEERAIAVGDFTLMKQGLLKFDYLQNETEIVSGDIIITSGSGGALPAELVIGTVQEVLTYDTGLARYATIVPAADLTSLSDVYLITSFEAAEDEG
jgi:rod shape-determining protein MreC